MKKQSNKTARDFWNETMTSIERDSRVSRTDFYFTKILAALIVAESNRVPETASDEIKRLNGVAMEWTFEAMGEVDAGERSQLESLGELRAESLAEERKNNATHDKA